jgi:hypothetical protein
MEQDLGVRDPEQVGEWVEAVPALVRAAVAGAREVVLRQGRVVLAFALTAAKGQHIN